jgi:hypothetical protein
VVREVVMTGDQKTKRTGAAALVALVLGLTACALACGSGPDEKASSANAAAPPIPQSRGSLDRQNITLKEYAALDKQSRLAVARHFAQTNEGNVAEFIDRIKTRNERLPVGTRYMDTRVDVARLPTEPEIDAHLLSKARELPFERASTEANRYCTKRNNEAITNQAAVK